MCAAEEVALLTGMETVVVELNSSCDWTVCEMEEGILSDEMTVLTLGTLAVTVAVILTTSKPASTRR